jgi:hypothetical protein
LGKQKNIFLLSRLLWGSQTNYFFGLDQINQTSHQIILYGLYFNFTTTLLIKVLHQQKMKSAIVDIIFPELK